MHCAATNTSQAYSPELQKKALANREQRQKDFDGFVTQLKDLSKSEKPSKYWIQDMTPSTYVNLHSLDRTEGERCQEVGRRAAATER